jgi:hypothetical protein
MNDKCVVAGYGKGVFMVSTIWGVLFDGVTYWGSDC